MRLTPVALALIIAALVGAGEAANCRTVAVSSNPGYVGVYGGPCNTFPVVENAWAGDHVDYTGWKGYGSSCSDGYTWAMVRWPIGSSSGVGFIAANYLAYCTDENDPCRKTTTNVNVRSGPCTSYDKLGVASSDSRVTYLGFKTTNTAACNDGVVWAQVHRPYDGVGVGYINSANLATCPSVGLTFPVDGLSLIDYYNFGQRRDSGKRCHCGCDILPGGSVVAVADGVVTNTYYFYSCSGGGVWAVLVYHASLGVTINYGEINTGAVEVSAGDSVSQGQFLGTATNCGMLHLEVYSGKVYANDHWYPTSGGYIGTDENCVTKYPSTKPDELVNCNTWLHQNFQ